MRVIGQSKKRRLLLVDHIVPQNQKYWTIHCLGLFSPGVNFARLVLYARRSLCSAFSICFKDFKIIVNYPLCSDAASSASWYLPTAFELLQFISILPSPELSEALLQFDFTTGPVRYRAFHNSIYTSIKDCSEEASTHYTIFYGYDFP